MFGKARARALKAGIPFNITVDDIVIPATCPVLGVPLFIGTVKDKMNSPSIDRIKPALGYVRGNVRVISNRANTLKSNATPIELMKVCLDTAIIHSTAPCRHTRKRT